MQIYLERVPASLDEQFDCEAHSTEVIGENLPQGEGDLQKKSGDDETLNLSKTEMEEEVEGTETTAVPL